MASCAGWLGTVIVLVWPSWLTAVAQMIA